MTYTSLLESVEESARERERELKEKAERTIRDLTRDTEEQSRLIMKKYLDSAVRAAIAERNRERYLVNAKNKQDVIRAKEELLSRSFSLAERELSGIRSDPRYPVIFSSLLKEALSSLTGLEVKIRIDAKDLALCTKELKNLSIEAEILPDITTAGGVLVTNRSGDIVIANTVESRLERARELLRLELFTILGGG